MSGGYNVNIIHHYHPALPSLFFIPYSLFLIHNYLKSIPQVSPPLFPRRAE